MATPGRSRPFLPRKIPRNGLHIEGWTQEWCYGTGTWILRWTTFFKHLAGQVTRLTGAELVLAQGTRPGGPTTRSQRRPPPDLL